MERVIERHEFILSEARLIAERYKGLTPKITNLEQSVTQNVTEQPAPPEQEVSQKVTEEALPEREVTHKATEKLASSGYGQRMTKDDVQERKMDNQPVAGEVNVRKLTEYTEQTAKVKYETFLITHPDNKKPSEGPLSSQINGPHTNQDNHFEYSSETGQVNLVREQTFQNANIQKEEAKGGGVSRKNASYAHAAKEEIIETMHESGKAGAEIATEAIESDDDEELKSCTVQIKGFAKSTSDGTLKLFLENQRKSGGGPIEQMTRTKHDTYLVTFKHRKGKVNLFHKQNNCIWVFYLVEHIVHIMETPGGLILEIYRRDNHIL